MSSSYYGGVYHDEAVYRSLKACGEGTRLHAWSRLVKPEAISLGRESQVDDFVLLAGGQGIDVGNRVHIASHVTVIGGGRAVVGDFAGIAAGCRIITGSDEHMGRGMTGPCVPAEYKFPTTSTVAVGKHAVLFTNVVVLPGVEVGEGCIVAANTVVPRSIEPWGIYAARDGRLTRVRDRPSENILRFERECIERFGY